ncbi:uncharacterized protein METZ01_LOCUS412130, partial [marine metagenome]
PVAEEPEKKEEEKLEFTPEGEALGYISADQARVLALQHARDNREVYGPFADRDLVWEVTSTEETEDYYEIRLSYVPAPPFNGEPGAELLTINKIGEIEFRQIVTPPSSRKSPVPTFALLDGVVAVVVVVAVLFATGVFSSGGVTGMAGGSTEETLSGPVTVAIAPDQSALLTSSVGDVTVSVASGSVDSPVDLIYTPLSVADIPGLPDDVINTSRVFDLSVSLDATGPLEDFSFGRPVTVTVDLDLSTIASSENNGSRIVIQHHEGTVGWQELPTT